MGAPVLAVGGCKAASVRRGWGCPVSDTAHSSQLQQTHHKAQLSPLVKMVASEKAYVRYGKKCHAAVRGVGKIARKTALQTAG